ncbi:ABC transporter substrate-binding protein [Alkalihalobacillus pseudalcaliphilus]|uniref:ABC transporter substrate-binding protein n=1 Tax=Alkalihalobacillus pseudalcaliphilus TaxID=79884 RepID=UPI00064E07AA|nr:ABC transporter substrate-binding protein [Alkalihalobacillus pseudalcaliphilus]KMK74960.1 ABC transporter substrate-binding protein [Alkalihalobacillus pseudalcaliphilus]
MKKLLMILTIVGLTVLAACGNDDTTTAPETDANSDQEQTAPAPLYELVENQSIPASDLSAIPANAVQRGNTVVATLLEPGGVFNPFFYTNGYDGNVTAVMFPPLVDVDETGEPYPRLAEDWTVSEDGLTYTFTLREGLQFDNGTPLTTEDVAFTLTLLHDPAYAGVTDITEAQVVGGLDYKEGNAESVSGIRVIDALTIEIDTEQANYRSLRLLGGQVLSKAYYGDRYVKGELDYIRDYHLEPVGAGPFKFDRYLPGQEIRYAANELYYEGKPEIDFFIYKTSEGDSTQFFQTGEVDYSGFPANPDNLELLELLGFADINVYQSSAYSFIKFNHEKEKFQDPRVKQAFIYGLDRQTIVDTAFQGFAQVANVPISPASWAYTEDVEPYAYNPEKAKQLLEEAGWVEGNDGIREKDGEKLVVYYFVTQGALSEVLIPIAKENYAEIGIQFEAEQMDYNAVLARTADGEHDLASFSTTMLSDPSDGVRYFQTNGGGSFQNTNGYSNERVDELIKAGVSTFDIQERTEIYHELYEELSEDPPYIFLSYGKILAGTNGRVEGFNPNGVRGITPSLPNLKVKEIE